MKQFENLCKKCMSDKGDLKQCPFCGYDYSKEELGLDKKNLILQEKYVLGNKISENAESICYIGYDIKNKSKVHIREFFPNEICKRDDDGLSVIVKESCNEEYENLKRTFLSYFRALAKVRDIDAIIQVYDIFTDYGTAYVVSETLDGITLLDFINKNKKPLDWDTAKLLFMPVISAFSRLNEAGILHLAINPESLIIGKNLKMYISNFSTPNLRKVGVFLNFEFHKGFTAPEQYIKNYKLVQATDVYGFTASLFFALVGFAPKDASERELDNRLLIPVKLLKNIPPHVVSALSNGLKVNIQKRTQTFELLRDELTETSAKYLKEQGTEVSQNDYKLTLNNKKRNFIWIIGAMTITLVLFILFFVFYMNSHVANKLTTKDDSLLLQDSNETQVNVVVPNFVGQSFDDLQGNIDSGDYNVFLSEKVFDDKFEEGKVISQIPQPGTSVKKGSSITVTVSKGPKFRCLPEVEGLTLSDAAAILTKEGFVPVQEDQYSNDVEQGKIIGYKKYLKGDKIEFGSQITIMVSKGKKE